LAHLGWTMVWRGENLFVYCLSGGIEATQSSRVTRVVSICPITAQAKIIDRVFTFGTLFVHVILNIRCSAAIARDGGLHILRG
jgi:hypothetical protein